MGLQMSQKFSQILCFQVNVFIIHWHGSCSEQTNEGLRL